MNSFRLERMSPLFFNLTLTALVLPAVLLLGGLFWSSCLYYAALGLTFLYLATWFWMRPTRFVVNERALEVIWPLRRLELPRTEITQARLIDRPALRRELGRCVRIGVGGLWGGFGWLWTQRRGIVQMHISRTDRFVWIERSSGRPWLLTPEQPEAFVRALAR